MSLEKLVAALDECGRRGISADLWLRDDDAVDPTGALDTLLDLCESFSVPVTLAVIPETTTRRLAQHLDASDIAQVAVHGWSHSNYAGDGQKKQELGLHRELPSFSTSCSPGWKNSTICMDRVSCPCWCPRGTASTPI